MLIREEQEADRAAVRALNLSAFETPAEADLVDTLRRDAEPLISLVADDAGVAVGHILFSPASLDGHDTIRLMGLAPMAVNAERRNQGIGTALVQAGLADCEALGADAVIVLGHPNYYPRFDFLPAARFGLRSGYDVPDEAFMIRELHGGCLAGISGIVRYHPAFDAL